MYKTKVSHNFMKKFRTKMFWSHGTILGYLGTLLGALGYLDALKIFFFTNNLLYYGDKFKILPHKVKAL